MAISKIKSGSIIDNAVNTNKLAPASVGSSDISTELVTGLTELSETAADADFTLIFDTSEGVLKKILRSNLKQSGPTISSISPTNATDSVVTQTFTITGTGFTAGSNARFIDSNGKIIEFDTVTRNSTTQITATIATSSLSGNNDPYDIQVTNGEGLSTLLASQVNFNASPIFVTASGSLGSDRISMAGVEVNATDPESAAPVTFELQSGSLPPGISITNIGANGGTATFTGTFSSPETSETIYNFTLRAVDAASNTTSRAFSFTALGPASESFTSSGTFNVPSGITVVDVLVVAGGGGTAPRHVGGGGAGGLIFMPDYPVTPGGTVSVTVGCGGAAADPGGSPGQDSVFGTLTAKGGGGSGADGQAGSGGSGAGEPGPGGGSGSATQPTQPGNSGSYGFGNPGGTNANPGGQGGGGGGAGAAGGNAPQGPADKTGRGGAGRAYTIADGTTPTYYAGGGGGGGRSSPTPATGGCGGQGGGGQGGNHQSNTAAQSGQANKGGGGGGGSCTPHPGGSGGKGIVVVRY